MGGGSAQVKPAAPGHRSPTASPTGLGAGSTVVDGVEVRDRPGPRRGRRDHRPGHRRAGHAGRARTPATAASCSTRHAPRRRSSSASTTTYPSCRTRAVLPARVGVDGPVELGVLGVGGWTVRVGDETHRVDLAARPVPARARRCCAPPAWTSRRREAATRCEVERRDRRSRQPVSASSALVARPAARPVADVLAEAVHAAERADVAVVVVGLTEEQETEAVDKTTLRAARRAGRPGQRRGGAARRRTVVVVNAATPVLMPWLDEVDAVLWAGLPGQEGGHAVAAALLGDDRAGRPAGHHVPGRRRRRARVGGDAGRRRPGVRRGLVRRLPRPRGRPRAGAGVLVRPRPRLRHAGSTAAAARRTAEGVEVQVEVTNAAHRDSAGGRAGLLPRRPRTGSRCGWSAGPGCPPRRGRPSPHASTCDPRVWRRWTDDGFVPLSDAGTVLVARGLGDVRGHLRDRLDLRPSLECDRRARPAGGSRAPFTLAEGNWSRTARGDQPHHLVGLAAGEPGVPDDEPGAVVVGGVGGERLDPDPELQRPLGHREVVDAVRQPQHRVQPGVDADDLELGQVPRERATAAPRADPRSAATPRARCRLSPPVRTSSARARAPTPSTASPCSRSRCSTGSRSRSGSTAQAIRSDGDRIFEAVPR